MIINTDFLKSNFFKKSRERKKEKENLFMHAFSLNCECDVPEQTADHILIAHPIRRAPHGAQGLTV